MALARGESRKESSVVTRAWAIMRPAGVLAGAFFGIYCPRPTLAIWLVWDQCVETHFSSPESARSRVDSSTDAPDDGLMDSHKMLELAISLGVAVG